MSEVVPDATETVVTAQYRRSRSVRFLSGFGLVAETVVVLLNIVSLRFTQTDLYKQGNPLAEASQRSDRANNAEGGDFLFYVGVIFDILGKLICLKKDGQGHPHLWRLAFIACGFAFMALSTYLADYLGAAQDGVWGQAMKNPFFRSFAEGFLNLVLVFGLVLIGMSVGKYISEHLQEPDTDSVGLTSIGGELITFPRRSTGKKRVIALGIGLSLVAMQFGLDYFVNSQAVQGIQDVTKKSVIVAVLGTLAIVLGLFVIAPRFLKAAAGGLVSWSKTKGTYLRLRADDYVSGNLKDDPYADDHKVKIFGVKLGRKAVLVPPMFLGFFVSTSVITLGFWVLLNKGPDITALCGGNVALAGAVTNLIFCSCFAIGVVIMSEINEMMYKLVAVELKKSLDAIEQKYASKDMSGFKSNVAGKVVWGTLALVVGMGAGILPTVEILCQFKGDHLKLPGIGEFACTPWMKVAMSFVCCLIAFCCARYVGIMFTQAATIVELKERGDQNKPGILVGLKIADLTGDQTTIYTS